ncbi:MAG: type II toxin-antitoxin system RelE/ParE family toxin [Kofleriaceae bacterium]
MRLLDGALHEMRHAAAKYEREREGLGDRFLDEVAAARNQIAALPESHQRWATDPDYRQAIVSVFPFVVFFRIDEARRTVVIVAIAHTRREPGYWKPRVEP